MSSTSAFTVSSRAPLRRQRACEWIRAQPLDRELLVIAPTLESGSRLLRDAAEGAAAAFGWQRITLRELSEHVAARPLAALGRAPSAPVALEATVARLLHEAREEGALGRFANVGERPGLARALARTFTELRLAGVTADAEGLDPDLARLLSRYEAALVESAIADRADVLSAAAAHAHAPHPMLGRPTLLFDLAVHHALEARFVSALTSQGELSAIAPSGDRRSIALLGGALKATPEELPRADRGRALDRLDEQLFGEVVERGPIDASVALFSAPGESRECVEIARRVRRRAADGVPFDRMAVLVHAPERYRSHLVEAFRRASLPAYFSRGTVRPDPAGRALLALLRCRSESLSARAFGEYLSLGVVPELEDDGAAPKEREIPWLPSADVEPEPEQTEATAEIDPGAPSVAGSLRAPWRWERLIVDASVIGGADRWRRRLHQLDAALAARVQSFDEGEEPDRAEWARKRRDDLGHLAAFALPLLDALEALPESATWGRWAAELSSLAERAIAEPARVLAALRELAPLGPIGPVGLTEVSLVLERRLTEMVARPSGLSAGRVFVGTTDEARGLSFHTVFVPGLAERTFPRQVREDPIVLDRSRRAISPSLATRETRVEQERLALRLATGAAEESLVLGYARLDGDRGRTRVPSFYALEVLRAIEGRLPSFGELAARAEADGGAKMAWPAPARPEDAIDGAEYDLAILGAHLRAPDTEAARGAARYLVEANPHLARALRARYLRWRPAWSRVDGLVNPSPPAREALGAYALDKQPYSATALESFAACPYRFYLRSILRLEPPLEPERLHAVDRRTRGQLVHAAQFECLARLRDAGLLPLSSEALPRAQSLLTDAIDDVASRFAEELAPAIDRVWRDSIAEVRADLAEWLARMTESPEWVPWRFELAFGLTSRSGRDPESREAPVELPEGLMLRGAIDLVERRADGALRATDHKTGRARDGARRIDGGRMLQPLLYARALEVLFGDAPNVVGGRLYYSTARGGFTAHEVSLDDRSRRALTSAVHTVKDAVDDGFLPAAPHDDECTRCDYVAVCGPAEARRLRIKQASKLGALKRLRKQE